MQSLLPYQHDQHIILRYIEWKRRDLQLEGDESGFSGIVKRAWLVANRAQHPYVPTWIGLHRTKDTFSRTTPDYCARTMHDKIQDN